MCSDPFHTYVVKDSIHLWEGGNTRHGTEQAIRGNLLIRFNGDFLAPVGMPPVLTLMNSSACPLVGRGIPGIQRLGTF